MFRNASVTRVAARYTLMKNAGPLRDVSKLRHQAVFMMGAGGSGKGYVSQIWMKYAPKGAVGSEGEERLLSNLNFEKATARLRAKGINLHISPTGDVSLPFRLYTYDHKGTERELDPASWSSELPPRIYKDVKGLKELIFSAPKHELPSYWRQVNPDIYKEEIPGYDPAEPGYVHEMSSEMSKAYFEAALETGDPLFIDGTGSNAGKMAAQMQQARNYGYSISLVLVSVPLTVNQIRNASRERKVDPLEVVRQWNLIQSNFTKLKSLADVSKVIVNRNDAKDIATFQENQDQINRFILKSTRGKYPSLYALIEALGSKSELRTWGPILLGGESLDNVVKKDQGKKDRAERLKSLLQARR
jgi:predicted kinase